METEMLELEKTSRERMISIRKDHGYSLEKIANVCKVTKTTVRKWEQGIIKTIKYEHIDELARFYNVSFAWIMGMDVPKQIETEEHKALRNKLSDSLMFYSLDDLKKIDILFETMFKKGEKQ